MKRNLLFVVLYCTVLNGGKEGRKKVCLRLQEVLIWPADSRLCSSADSYVCLSVDELHELCEWLISMFCCALFDDVISPWRQSMTPWFHSDCAATRRHVLNTSTLYCTAADRTACMDQLSSHSPSTVCVYRNKTRTGSWGWLRVKASDGGWGRRLMLYSVGSTEVKPACRWPDWSSFEVQVELVNSSTVCTDEYSCRSYGMGQLSSGSPVEDTWCCTLCKVNRSKPTFRWPNCWWFYDCI